MGYKIEGVVDKIPWSSGFPPVPGRADTLELVVPIGLKDAQVDCAREFLWWTWAPEIPRQVGHGPTLAKVEGDMPDIVVQRVRPGSLEIRLKAGAGKLPGDDKIHVFVHHPGRDRGDGGPVAQNFDPGVYRVDRQVLPGREMELWISAEGFLRLITKPFQLTEEGQEGVVELTLTPGVEADPDGGFRRAEAVEVPLKDRAGRPILRPAEPEGARRSIACRAVDKATGAPIVGAEVVFTVEQSKDEQGEDSRETLEEHATKTDADGRYVVTVPRKYLPPLAPKQSLDVRVEIRHPGYVEWFGTEDVREIAAKGASDDAIGFRLARLPAARTLTGRVFSPDGKPLGDVTIYKDYDRAKPADYPLDGDIPQTDAEGRFRTNVPVGKALKLEFRAADTARNYVDIPADKSDLGDIRLSRGVRVAGRVLDADGRPVKWINVTTPSVPDQAGQPNFNYTTEPDGSFRTDELPPGQYLAKVGDIHRDDEGKSTGFAFKDAPGVYLPAPLLIRPDGRSEPAELIFRPSEHVRFVARQVTTRPKEKDEANPRLAEDMPGPDDPGSFGGMLMTSYPIFVVRGKIAGRDWFNQLSFAEMGKGKDVYSVRVPKGLEDATLELPFVPQRFRLAPDGPELFGPAYRLGRVERDRPEIRLRRYAPTVLKVRPPAPAPGGLKVEAHYVREPEMKAAGVVFKDPTPVPLGTFAASNLRFPLIPDEEVEITATAPGLAFEPLRLKLAEGETREVTPKQKP